MPRRLREQVIVITGASSGIGRDTAIEAGRCGAAVVLAARNEQALEEVATQIRQEGGRAHAVVTDVSDWSQVRRLADEAVRHFGRIDTWVNNAAISLYSPVDKLEPQELEQVLRVNVVGLMLGCRAAMEKMKPRGGGTIINLGSALSDRAVPLASAYVASKFAVRGFTDALRMELKHERSRIEVVLVLPASINTPLFARARSKLGVKPRPIPPVYDPRVVTEAILSSCVRPQRQVYAGQAGRALAILERFSPRLLDWWMLQGGRMFRKQVTDVPTPAEDNLFKPVPGPGQARGEWSGEVVPHIPRPVRRQMRGPVLIAMGLLGAALLFRRH
jgi:short-subunit dehydrogenase